MAGETATIPLIPTKLHRPPVAGDHLHRQQLLDRLNQRRQRPLTLISASAGYGKTTLASCWLEACDIPGGWVSLDKNDNDLRMFTAYFIAAVARLFPGACRNTQALLNVPDLPPIEAFAASLIKELDRVEQPFIMVLDDYYLIKETVVHTLLAEILRHPPKSLHLVIVGRWDPPLPISKLRAQGLVTEVRTQDLRLTVAETATFLERLLGIQIDTATAAALEKKTEGWVTGLRLAAISMRHRGNIDLKLLEPQVEAQYVMEYLLTEVFSQQPPEISQYLLATAILDRFCGPLCEAVRAPLAEPFTGEMDGREFISWLEKENMFLVPLDAKNRWFRFHHLFQKLLSNRLKRHFSSEDINGLHAKASAWFAENGLIEEAIRHALTAGEENRAADLVEQNRQAMLNTDRWYVIEKWLSMLPDTVIQQRPELLLAQAWVHYFHFRLTLIPSVLDVAESLLSNKPNEQTLYGEIYLFKGVLCFLQGDGAPSLKFIQDAMGRIPTTYHMIRGFTECYFGFAGQMQGQKERVLDELSDLLHYQPLNDIRKVRVMVSLVCIHMVSGNLTAAAALNQQLKNLAISIESTTNVALSLYFQGVIHLCRNELKLAIDYLSQAAELSYTVPRRASVDCLAGLALAYQAMQQTDKAFETLERLFEYIDSLDDSSFLVSAHSCRARVSLIKGEAPFASGLPNINTTSGGETVLIFLEIPGITQCRVFLAEGSDAGLREADKKLQEYLRLSQTQHNTFQKITIMVLQAVTFEKQGRTDDALAVLEEAVDLARPGGWIRPFVESGPTMEGLLKRLTEKNIAVDYIRQLLTALREYQLGVKPEELGTQVELRPSFGIQPLVEPLTNRELEILELLAQRLRNKEIAAKLFISEKTIKKHLNNIYRKLNVTSRRQALEKAVVLGILVRR